MTKLSLIAFTAIVAAAGFAAPALAATSTSAVPNAVSNAPNCPVGNSTDYDQRIDDLSTQLQLSTKLGWSIGVSGGCIEVTTIEDHQVTMSFYDPDSLNLVAQIG